MIDDETEPLRISLHDGIKAIKPLEWENSVPVTLVHTADSTGKKSF